MAAVVQGPPEVALDERAKHALSTHFSEPGRVGDMSQLCSIAGISSADAFLLISTLRKSGHFETFLYVYHCDYLVPVGMIPFGQGFATPPFHCLICGEEDVPLQELRYKPVCRSRSKVVFL